jgi:predicted PurR-regulated permease PerM
VVLVYLGLLLVLGLTGLVVAPAAASQLYQLGLRLPEYAYTLPDLVTRWQADLARLGLDVDLTDALRSQELIRRAQDVGAYLVQNLVTIAAGVANLLANLFIILILSFYMTLDGPALSRRALELVPPDWRDEARVLRRSWTAPSAASCVGSSSRAPFSAWVPW